MHLQRSLTAFSTYVSVCCRGATLAFGFILISGCASPQPDPIPVNPPPNVHVPAVSRDDVLALLANANDVQVTVTRSDLELMAQNNSDHKDSESLSDALNSMKQEVDHCNTNGYILQYADNPGPTSNEESECYGLGHDLAPLLGRTPDISSNVDLTAAEIAFARACVAPKANGIPTSGCVDLGTLYEYEGKPELALAVYQNAKKCQGALAAQSNVLAIDPDQQEDWSNLERKDCLKNEVALLASMHRNDAERSVAATLCNADSEMGCEYLKSLGVNVNIQAVEHRQAELQAANEATAAADHAADARANVEAEATFTAKMQALRSLPGGSDPNAIIDSTSQQAANIDALDTANDAALHQATEQRREQVTTQQVHGNAQQSVQSSSTNSSDASTYTYVQPATDCLSYAADQNSKGILVRNNCKDEVILTWARPAGTHVGLDHAIQGGPDIVPAGGTDSIPPHPVHVFACHEPGTPTKPGQENSSSDWQLEYTDTAFTCPALNQAVKTP